MEPNQVVVFTTPVNQRVKELSFVVNVYKNNFGSISGEDQVTCKRLIGEYNAQLVAMAIIETAETGAAHNVINSIQKKLEKWCRQGISSIDDLETARRKQLQEHYTAS